MSSTDVMALVRPDLRAFAGYRSARSESLRGDVWLNANESPWANPADLPSTTAGGVRRYPDPQPQALRQALAALYDVTPGQLLAGRGSDEAIDLLVRALCPPGDGAYECDFDAVAGQAEASGARLVFLCSPGNPTGRALPLEAIDALAARLEPQAVVVVDEAYGEFSQAPSAATLLARRGNLAVLRTLSKAHALAAARIGAVLAAPALIDVLRRCQAPYPLPTPCVELALQALAPAALDVTRARVATVRVERERLRDALQSNPAVRRVYPSDANFLLCRFADVQAAFDALLAAGIVVRDMRAMAGLEDALRISIGTPGQNRRVVDVLSSLAVAA